MAAAPIKCDNPSGNDVTKALGGGLQHTRQWEMTDVLDCILIESTEEILANYTFTGFFQMC